MLNRRTHVFLLTVVALVNFAAGVINLVDGSNVIGGVCIAAGCVIAYLAVLVIRKSM